MLWRERYAPESFVSEELKLSLEQGRKTSICRRKENLLPTADCHIPKVVQEGKRIQVVYVSDRVVDENSTHPPENG